MDYSGQIHVALPIYESNATHTVVRTIIFQTKCGDAGHLLVTDKDKPSLAPISVTQELSVYITQTI